MAERVPQGKGSKDRTKNRKSYDANFDGIRWSSKTQTFKPTKPSSKKSSV